MAAAAFEVFLAFGVLSQVSEIEACLRVSEIEACLRVSETVFL